jgi:DNA-binding transcriptional regulator YiaG
MYERHRYGQRIGVDAAMKLVEKWDVTLDYIYYGRRHGVEQPLWEDLQAAEKYVIEQEGRGDCEEEAKRASPTADLVPERASIADESNKGVGERIVLIRTRLHNNVTQEDFADTHGFTRSAVSLWETGARRPKPPDATTIARYYGVSLDWIYTGEIGNLKVEVRERLLRTKAKP